MFPPFAFYWKRISVTRTTNHVATLKSPVYNSYLQSDRNRTDSHHVCSLDSGLPRYRSGIEDEALISWSSSHPVSADCGTRVSCRHQGSVTTLTSQQHHPVQQGDCSIHHLYHPLGSGLVEIEISSVSLHSHPSIVAKVSWSASHPVSADCRTRMSCRHQGSVTTLTSRQHHPVQQGDCSIHHLYHQAMNWGLGLSRLTSRAFKFPSLSHVNCGHRWPNQCH